MTISWVIVFVGLTFFFANKERSDFNPNDDLRRTGDGNITEIQLQQNRYNHYVMTGKINGKSVTFLLDTGATDVVIPQKIANKLKLAKGPSAYAKTANGTIEVSRTKLRKLELGPIQLYDVNASINPAMGGNEILLGMSALSQLEFTQRGETLTIRQF